MKTYKLYTMSIKCDQGTMSIKPSMQFWKPLNVIVCPSKNYKMLCQSFLS